MAVAPRQRPSLSAARSPQPMAPWPARRCWVWHERIATGEGVAAGTLPFATTAVRGSSGCAVAAWSARSGGVRPSSHGHEGQERGAKHCGVRGILCDCWALLPPCTPLSKHSPRLLSLVRTTGTTGASRTEASQAAAPACLWVQALLCGLSPTSQHRPTASQTPIPPRCSN